MICIFALVGTESQNPARIVGHCDADITAYTGEVRQILASYKNTYYNIGATIHQDWRELSGIFQGDLLKLHIYSSCKNFSIVQLRFHKNVENNTYCQIRN
jgi:hypothetical protein